MSIDDNRSAARKPLNIFFQPCQLVVSQLTESASPEAGSSSLFEGQDIVQPNKMNSFIIEASPPLALSSFSISLKKNFSVIREHVMLAGNVIHLARLRTLKHLRRRVELVWCRKMCNIASVNQKCGLLFQSVDSVHGLLESLRNILVRLFVESDMTVTDLDEAEYARLLSARHETTGCKHSRVHCPDKPGAGPCHAL